VPLALVITWNTLADRPYWIDENDMEHDSYYSSRLAFEGKPIRSTHHPGTPSHFLGCAVMRLTGPEAGRFLTTATLLLAFLTSASLWIFVTLLAPYHPPSVLALAAAVALCWPSVLLHLDYFGADSLIISLSLLTVAFFGRYVMTGSYLWIALCGLALGTALATKLSALPLAAALGVGTLTFPGPARLGFRSSWKAAGLLVLCTGAVFAVWVAPIAESVPGMISLTMSRPEINMPRRADALLSALARVGPRLAALEWPALALLAGCLAISMHNRRRHWRVAVFGFTSLAALTYLVLTAARQEFSLFGIQVRNSTPIWMTMPLIVLFALRKPARWQWAAAAVLLVWPLVGHTRDRQEFISDAREAAARTLPAIERAARQVPRGVGRIAIWDGSPGTLRAMSFHCWGNWRYAAGGFSKQVDASYGMWTCLHLRNMQWQPPTPVDYSSSRFGALGEWIWSLRAHGTSRGLDASMVAGSSPVSMAVFPVSEWRLESQGLPLERLISRLGWPAAVVRKKRIGADEWFFLSRSPASPPGREWQAEGT